MSVRLVFVAPLLSLIAIVAIAAIFLFSNLHAHAVPGSDIAQIAVDLNTTGNTVTQCTTVNHPTAAYPCNSSTTLGAIQTCRQIAVGETITIDVVGKNIPNGGVNGSNLPDAGASGSDGQLAWTPNGPTGPIEVTAKDFSVALIHQGPADNASTSTNPSLPDNTGVWNWGDTDVNPDLAGEGGPGIAVRISITAINPGIAVLSLQPNTLAQTNWFDVQTNEFNSENPPEGATIAVGVPCTTPSPTPAPTPTPTPPPTTMHFIVHKDFSDKPSTDTTTVSITMTCAGATPDSSPKNASEATPANFLLSNISGATCSATESVPAGYTASQGTCAGLHPVAGTDINCTITNTLNSATFTVSKDFSDNPPATRPSPSG